MTWSPPAWHIGDRLRKVRESAGMRLDDLAGAAGITRQTLGPWENGQRTPSPAALAQVVRALAPRVGATEEDLAAWLRDG